MYRKHNLLGCGNWSASLADKKTRCWRVLSSHLKIIQHFSCCFQDIGLFNKPHNNKLSQQDTVWDLFQHISCFYILNRNNIPLTLFFSFSSTTHWKKSCVAASHETTRLTLVVVVGGWITWHAGLKMLAFLYRLIVSFASSNNIWDSIPHIRTGSDIISWLLTYTPLLDSIYSSNICS